MTKDQRKQKAHALVDEIIETREQLEAMREKYARLRLQLFTLLHPDRKK